MHSRSTLGGKCWMGDGAPPYFVAWESSWGLFAPVFDKDGGSGWHGHIPNVFWRLRHTLYLLRCSQYKKKRELWQLMGFRCFCPWLADSTALPCPPHLIICELFIHSTIHSFNQAINIKRAPTNSALLKHLGYFREQTLKGCWP